MHCTSVPWENHDRPALALRLKLTGLILRLVIVHWYTVLLFNEAAQPSLAAPTWVGAVSAGNGYSIGVGAQSTLGRG